MKEIKEIVRDFKLTTLALNNKNTVYLILFILVIFGMSSYVTLPKELFPEVNFPTVMVQTIYPGNSAEDMENLVSKELEKELKSLKGIKSLKSTSVQDVSMLFVEYSASTKIDDVLQDVKDAVDKARADLPDDLPSDPAVIEVDFSEFPIININISGDYNLDELKEYAEYFQDEFEGIQEISKVGIKGLSEKEIQINVDIHKMESMGVSFTAIENAIAYENMTISGGDIEMNDARRSVRIIGEFQTIDEIRDIVVKNDDQSIVYLKDVAEVVNTYADAESYARLNKNPVVSLQVIKKSGENLINATDNIYKAIELAREIKAIPADLTITITNDQSEQVRAQLSNLENSMVIAIIFVVSVLFFFLGLRNASLVGFAIPISMLLSFVILSAMGTTINMIILFGLILALGMLVDNALVVVENIYRFVDNGYSIQQAAKQATGEIAIPIIASTLTTLAAFFPLIFWNSLMGEFMKYLPITLIIVLSSSLFAALVITPVLATKLVKAKKEEKPINKRKLTIISLGIIAFSVIFYVTKKYSFANILMFSGVLTLLYTFVLANLANWFQNVFLVWLENIYVKFISFSLKGIKPYLFLVATIFMLFATIFVFFGVRQPDVSMFPANEPEYINIIAEFPVGIDLETTDSLMKIVETDLYEQLEPNEKNIESVLTTVGKGASRENETTIGNNANRAIITIKFIDFQDRENLNTSALMKNLSSHFNKRYSGISFFVEKNKMGPPAGSPINLEISGKEMPTLIALSDSIISKIENSGIDGIEELKIDIEIGKPELLITIDREKSRRFGLSTGQIATSIRTAIFGKEISSFKVGEDEYPIQLRFAQKYRYNLSSILNQKMIFRNPKGQMLEVPISAVADIKFSSSYGAIKRTDQERTVTVFSNVIEGYNANKINQLVQAEIANFNFPDGYGVDFTGEQEEMKESMAFLTTALVIAIALILIILVTQFNSIFKPLIILASVLFSTIGVFGGIAAFDMDFIVIMTGIGIISLAGVVVNNAIVLIDYIDFLKSNRKKELGLEQEDNLSTEEIVNCIVKAGQTRLRPVLLTAITTILGLVPMAIGLNINFATLLSEFNPQIFFGGENASFWGPMASTVIFGLTFGTFLTLVIVPTMYLIGNKIKLYFVNKKQLRIRN